jgi:hypothetical protein
VYWVHLAHNREMADTCGHGNESSGFTKSGEFLEQLGDYQFHKKDPTPEKEHILDTYQSCNVTYDKDQLHLTQTVGNV